MGGICVFWVLNVQKNGMSLKYISEKIRIVQSVFSLTSNFFNKVTKNSSRCLVFFMDTVWILLLDIEK